MSGQGAPPPQGGRLSGLEDTELRTLYWPTSPSRGGALIVHGLGEHAGRYDHVARRLNAIGLEAYGYDLQGHGDSGGRRGHVARFDQFLRDLDRAWSDAETRFAPGARFVLSHSMGGLIALDWCQTRQPALTGVVVSAPWLATAQLVPGWKRAASRIADRVLPGLSMDSGIRPEHVTSDPAMMARMEKDRLRHTRVTARLFAEVNARQTRVREGADLVKVASLFIVPGADPLTDLEVTRSFARALPSQRTEVLEVPGARHEAFNERGGESVLDAVCAWMDGRMANLTRPND